MSLINDVLKNLERKRDHSHPSFIAQSFDLQEDDDESLFLKALGVIVILALLGVLVYGIMMFYKHHKKTHLAQSTPIATTPQTTVQQRPEALGISPAAEPAPTAASPTLPKLASAIHINDLPTTTEVEISLNGSPTYLTASDPSRNTVTLTLAHTYLDTHKLCTQLGNPPNCSSDNNIPLPINGTALEGVHIDQNDGQSLGLTFKLTPQAILQNTQLIPSPTTSLKLIFSKDKNAISSAVIGGGENSMTQNISSMNSAPLNASSINEGPTDDTVQGVQPVADKSISEESSPYHQVNELILQQKFDSAQQAFNHLSKADQQSIKGIILQAKIYLATNKNMQALQLLQPQDANDQPPEFYAVYAATLTFNKKYDQAVTVYKKLVNYWPDNPNWWLGLGIAAQNNNESALAQDSFQHVISFTDISPEVKAYVHSQLDKLNISYH